MMFTNTKGQLFSLDFVLSVIAVVVAIGLALQAYELSAYDSKESLLSQEMYFTAVNAAERLTASPAIACGVTDTSGNLIPGYTLVNCIDSTKVQGTITKAFLGIPSYFDCEITGLNVQECKPSASVISSERNIKTIQRFVYVSLGPVSKKALNDCLNNNPSCIFNTKRTITVKVMQ
jgi:uncharacterized protein (UPF0333 family)